MHATRSLPCSPLLYTIFGSAKYHRIVHAFGVGERGATCHGMHTANNRTLDNRETHAAIEGNAMHLDEELKICSHWIYVVDSEARKDKSRVLHLLP